MLPQEAIWLDADGLRLQQAFGNLLDNASKFSPTGGRIRLTAEIAKVPHGEEVTICVKDDGIGIEPALLPQVFELFTQADTSASRSHSGLGIGLTLTKHFIELHGGTIEVRSAGLNQGSEFIVRLPVLDRGRGPEKDADLRGAEGSTVSLRILVVDDDADGARGLGMLLKSVGHVVRVVLTSEESLHVADAFRPQVIILDLGMPGMDGFEVAKRLRRSPVVSNVLLIALSGFGRDTDRRKSREAGFDCHLVKPTDLETLQRILGTCQT